MNILITGGAGLIGYNTAKHYLAKGWGVVVVDNLERSTLLGHKVSDERVYYNAKSLEQLGADVFYRDVSLPDTWKILDSNYGSFDAIAHLAAQCGVPTSLSDPGRDFEVNTIGTFNMLEMARKWDAKVVYASTNKVYPLHSMWTKVADRWIWAVPEWHENGFPISAMDRASRTPYGASKYCGDVLCQEFFHSFGVRTGVFRMSCIYGPNQFGFEEQGWATWFVIATLKNLPIKIYGDGCQVRDMLYVDDLVEAYDSFISDDELDHGVWNMGGGPINTLSLNECLNELERLIGKRSPVSYYDWRPSDQRVYTTDIRPAMKDLRWEPLVDPIEGLAAVTEWVEPILHVF